MGKRNKEQSHGRRRPMIQLGGNQNQGISAVSRKTKDEKTTLPSDNNESKPVDPMDDQLAGFLAEINSLETPETSSNGQETSNTQSTTTITTEESPNHSSANMESSNHSSANMLYDPESFDPSTQSHLLPENWQACYDDNTMCYYYWNMVTNQVQWYPPVATIPPPPPPPANEIPIDEQQKENIKKTDDNSNLNTSKKSQGLEFNEECIDSTIVNKNKNEMEHKNSEPIKENSCDDDSASNKTKDKELMSQIKERIRKKKEEKLKKELEQNKNVEGGELAKKQQEKEETLRERLIRKKHEREHAEKNTPDKKDEKSGEQTLDQSIADKSSFSLDMFAEESKARKVDDTRLKENTEDIVKKNETLSDSQKESSETFTAETKEPYEPSKQKYSDTLPAEVIDKTSTRGAEVIKSEGWRIVDDLYDDDDDDDDEEEQEREDEMDDKMQENSSCENKKNKADENVSVEESKPVTGKKVEEMDDYADMLLEDAIEKDDTVIITTKKVDKNSNVQPAPPSAPPPSAPPPPDHAPPPPEEEPLPVMEDSTLSGEDHGDRKQIASTTTELFEKLHFLDMNRKDFSNLQIYYMELETRMRDWQAGALNAKYFMEKINELDVEMQKYEESAAPQGWMCHWNSEYKMYYYNNLTTGASQWDYPVIDQQQQQQQQLQQQPTIASVSHATNAAAAFQAAQVMVMQPHLMPMMNIAASVYPHAPMMMAAPAMNVSTSLTTAAASAVSLVSPSLGFSRDPIHADAKKRSAEDSDATTNDPYRDPYRAAKKKKEIKAFPDQTEDNLTTSETESGPSSPVAKSVIAAAPVIRDMSREGSPSFAAMSDDYQATFSPKSTAKTDNPAQVILNSKLKPTKKKKKLDASGLPSKKMKQVSSLVQKWQTVKQQVEEEENVDEEYEEDVNYEMQSEKRIEEWKKEMENSGKKGYNPNFEEIKGDWRARLKRKSTT